MPLLSSFVVVSLPATSSCDKVPTISASEVDRLESD
jgi:hypothetical protein